MIEFKLPELGENIEQGDLVRLMVAPGAKCQRRPVGHGTGNRQGRRRSAVVGERNGAGNSSQRRRQDQGRPSHLHRRTERKPKLRSPSDSAAKPGGRSTCSQFSKRPRRVADLPRRPAARAAPHAPAPASAAFDQLRSQRIQTPRTRRKHFSGRSGSSDDLARHESFRRPAGDGAGNRQGRRRSAVLGQRRGQRSQSKRRREDQSWTGDLHAGRRSSGSGGDHARAQRSGRTCFRTARSAPGVSGGDSRRGQDRRTGAASRSAAAGRAGVQHARATGQSCRHRTSPGHSRRAACAATGARNRRRHLRSERHRPGRTHQRRRRQGVRERLAVGCGYRGAGAAARRTLRAAAASGLRQVGQGRARLDARSSPQDRRASGRSLEHDSARHAAGPRRHHRTRTAARPLRSRRPKKPAAR